MADKIISIGFIFAGKDGINELIIKTGQLRKAMDSVVSEAEKLDQKFINLAALSTALSSAQSTFQQLNNVLNDLSATYAQQEEVEAKLANTMRNTMNARDADIQSIKDLCSAQQQIGVIGHEVQLAGAQELATYLSEKESLEKLIPVMNDMVAQQYGLNAAQENAAQIATMLGKVMDGQVNARYSESRAVIRKQINEVANE